MWQAAEISSSNSDQEQGLYEVEKILSKRFRKQNGQNICEYLIKWKGYPRLQDQTWQPIQHLQTVPQLISEFENKQRKQKRIEIFSSKEDSSSHSKRGFQDKDKKRNEAIDKLTKKVKTDIVQNHPQRNKVIDNSKQANLIQAKNLSVRLQQNHQAQKDSIKLFKKDIINSNNNQILPTFAEKNILEKKYPLIQQKRSSQSKYGKIVNHLYKNQQLFYEVEVLNQNKIFDRAQIRRASELRKYCSEQISEYLENYLVFLIKFNKAQK